jgi:drug/metabolite transporter (DMT)-like permease
MSKSVTASAYFQAALLANFLWASSFIASKFSLVLLAPAQVNLYRFFIALIFLGLIFSIQKRISWKQFTDQIFLLSLLGGLQYCALYNLQLEGLQYISTSLSAALMLLSPLFIVLLSFFLNKKLTPLKILSPIIGLVGGLIIWFDHLQLKGLDDVGVHFTLAAALALAISTLLTKKLVKSVDVYNLTFWPMLIGVFFLVVGEVINQEKFVWINVSELTPIIYLALFCTIAPFMLWNLAMSKCSAQLMASSMHIKTPAAILIGFLIGQETLSLPFMVGSVTIMFAIWLSGKIELRGNK